MAPLFACGLGPGALPLILFVGAAWWIRGALALVNPFLISSLQTPERFKTANFACWACYVLPGIFTLLALYGFIAPPGITAPERVQALVGVLWVIYVVTIPFITASHFILLIRLRRKLRVTGTSQT